MERPTNIAIVAAVIFAGAIVSALAGMAFFAVALLIASGSGSGEPVSIAIIGMGLSGGFALLILACLATCLGMNVVEFRDRARHAFTAVRLGALGQTARSVFSSATRSWAAAFPSRNKNTLVPSFKVRSLGCLKFARVDDLVTRELELVNAAAKRILAIRRPSHRNTMKCQ